MTLYSHHNVTEGSVWFGCKFKKRLYGCNGKEIWDVESTKIHKPLVMKVIGPQVPKQEVEGELLWCSKSLLSNFTICYYGSWWHAPSQLWFFLMERCDGGSLLSKFWNEKSPNRDMILRQIIIQLLLGLDFLHSNGLKHNDMHARNVFVDKNFNVKIGDFGLLQKSTSGHSVNDVGMMGVIFYQLVTGVEQDNRKTLTRLKDVPNPVPSGVCHPEIHELIRAMIHTPITTKEIFRIKFVQRWARNVNLINLLPHE